MQDPKPCPFCGHEKPAVSDGNNGLHFRVICGKGACRAAGPLERCAIDAVNEWNKRVASTEIEHLQSQLNAATEALASFVECYPEALRITDEHLLVQAGCEPTEARRLAKAVAALKTMEQKNG